MRFAQFRFILLGLALLSATAGCRNKEEQVYESNMLRDRAVVRKIFVLNGLDPEEKQNQSPHLTVLDEVAIHDMKGNLEFLNLSNRGISSVPPEIGSLFALKELDLAGNELQSVPQELGNLVNLKNLDLGQNSLTELPESIGNLNKLERLDVGDNRLAELPSTLGRLSELSELWVAGNQLSKFPDSLQGLHNLTYVAIVRNDFSEFPRNLLQIPNFGSILADDGEIDTSNLPEGVSYEGNGSFVYTRSPE